MAELSSFIFIVDRYLEVSNVYHRRMLEDSLVKDDASRMGKRLEKLLMLVEKGVSTAQKPFEIKEVELGQEKGQIVTSTTEFLQNTKNRQNDLLYRLDNMPGWAPTPTNMNRFKILLKKDAVEFLGCFPSPSYASDVLNEFASLTVCPDVKLLAARDLIHMHVVELRLHLVRLVEHLNPEIHISGAFRVDELNALAKNGELVERLVELAVPRDPSQLIEELEPCINRIEEADEWLLNNREIVFGWLEQESRSFYDTLEEIETFKEAMGICNSLVVFGLIATYSAWLQFALENDEERGSFRTNILFCTRILLDEERWDVCRDFTKIALGAMRELNATEAMGDESKGTGMLTANSFFARRKCGEDLIDMVDEIKRWDVTELHPRYQFLKHILLEEFDEARDGASDLIEPCQQTGVPNMCREEFNEWPILKDFLNSEYGKDFCLDANG